MQLTTQHETIENEETRYNSGQPMKIKYGHRYRKKKFKQTDSQDTVLEFDENEDFKDQSSDSVQDGDSNRTFDRTDMSNDLPNDRCEKSLPISESSSEKHDSSTIINNNSSPIANMPKKCSLPNNLIIQTTKQSQSANNSPDVKITRKKFSLPGDILTDHNINDRAVLDVNSFRKKYNSSANLPDDSHKLDDSSIDGSLKRKCCSTDGSEGRCRLDSKVGEFVQEVMYSISEIGYGNPGDGVRKLRGIIKKTLSCEKDDPSSNVICIKRREKCKNTVHFSEENITIEIPRPSKPYLTKIKDKMCYYCCFGFLFPNA